MAEGAQVKRGDASVNGDPGVVLTIVKQPHVDTRALTDRGQGGAAARSSRRCRPTWSSRPTCSSSATSSTAASTTSARRWSIGAVLVLIVLFLFLLNFRTTFISLTAIPLSLVVTALVFRLVGALTGTRAVDQRDDAGRHRRGDGRAGRRRHRGRREHLPPAAGEQRTRPTRSRRCGSSTRRASRSARPSSSARRSSSSCSCRCSPSPASRAGSSRRSASPTSSRSWRRSLVSLTVTPVLSYYLLAQSKAAHRERRRLPASAA